MEKIKIVPYRLGTIDHTKFKLFCITKGVSMQEMMDMAVQEYLKKWEA